LALNLKDEISETFSAKVYGIILGKNNSIRRAFADGKMGGGRIIAKLNGRGGHGRKTQL